MARILLFTVVLLAKQFVYAQDGPSSSKHKKVRISPLPVVYYSPETRFGYGALLAANFKVAEDTLTSGSYIQTSYIRTVNKQYEWVNKGRLYGKGNRNVTEYRVYYSYFPEYYFGYQVESPDQFKELIEYQRLWLEGKRYWKVKGHIYAGVYARLNRIYNLVSPAGGVFQNDKPPGYKGYTVVGFSPAFSFDSRDSQVYPTKGKFFEILWVSHTGAMTDFVFGNLRLDARSYFSPGKMDEDVLAFQFFASLNGGIVPFKDMADIGGPNTMRGYYRGYFRYRNLLAFQMEYRFILFKYIGFTGWLGASTTSEDWYDPFRHAIHPNAGVGLRVRINQQDKLSIRADYGVGKDQNGFYLDLAEAY